MPSSTKPAAESLAVPYSNYRPRSTIADFCGVGEGQARFFAATPPKDFLPPSRSGKRTAELHFDGVGEPLIGEIEKKTNGAVISIPASKPVEKLLKTLRLRKGDRASLLRVGPKQYRVAPLRSEFRFIDLFAGIGGIRLAFEGVGGRCVFSSEIDRAAQQTYEANFDEMPEGDITQIPPESIPDHDVLLGGFPCQPFSIIGKQKGFGDTRGTLFFNIEEILRVKRPFALLLENVKQFKTHDAGRTYATVIKKLQELGYHTHSTVLNALDYGVPQRRERTFIVGFQEDLPFTFPEPFPFRSALESVLEDDSKVEKNLFASKQIACNRANRLKKQGKRPFYPSIWHENKAGNIGMHPYSCALRANASYNYLLVNGRRRLSSRECLRMQGFPDEFKIVVSHSAIRTQAGNSVAVPVIAAIATQMMNAIRGRSPQKRLPFPLEESGEVVQSWKRGQ